MASVIAVHGSAPSAELSHCQLTSPATKVSGSSKVAVIRAPARGVPVDNVTVPGSSTFVTLTVTSRSALSPFSLAFTVNV